MSRWQVYAEEINNALSGRFTLVHGSSKYIEYGYQHRDALYEDKKMFYMEVTADKRCRSANVVRIWSETRKDGIHKKLFDLPSVPLQYVGVIFDAWLDHVNDLVFSDAGLTKDQYQEFDQVMHEVYSDVVLKPMLAKDLSITVDNPGAWSFDYDKSTYATRAVYKLDVSSALSVRRWRMPGVTKSCYLVSITIPVNRKLSSFRFPLIRPEYLKEFCDCVIYVCEHEMRRVGTMDEQVFTRCGFPAGDQYMRFRLRLKSVINRYQTAYGYKMHYPQLPQ